MTALVVMTACGDDDRPPGGTDSGRVDGGTTGDAGRPPDAGNPPDGSIPGMCGGGACDIQTGGGCGMAGQGCYYLAAGPGMMPAAMCVTAGTAGDGAACENTQDCREGNHCDAAAAGGMGECRKLCCWGSDVGCPAGQRCQRRFVDEMGTELDVGFCVPSDSCTLVPQAGCDPPEACYPLGNDGSTECRAPGTATAGMECGATVGCAGGTGCYQVGSETSPFQCYTFCDRTAATPCLASETCQPLNYPAPADHVGICVPMT
jgi:hypothetical protein